MRKERKKPLEDCEEFKKALSHVDAAEGLGRLGASEGLSFRKRKSRDRYPGLQYHNRRMLLRWIAVLFVKTPHPGLFICPSPHHISTLHLGTFSGPRSSCALTKSEEPPKHSLERADFEGECCVLVVIGMLNHTVQCFK